MFILGAISMYFTINMVILGLAIHKSIINGQRIKDIEFFFVKQIFALLFLGVILAIYYWLDEMFI